MIDLLIRPWNEETQRAAKPGLLSRLRSLLEVNGSELTQLLVHIMLQYASYPKHSCGFSHADAAF